MKIPKVEPEAPVKSLSADLAPDLTGRNRIVRNVLTSWAGHFLFIVAGFIMPRMIDERLGQDILGIWDLSWSVVSYINLVQLGIGSSISRFVAKCRAAGDEEGVNRAVSSVWVFLFAAGVVAFLLTAGLCLSFPYLFAYRLARNTATAQWVVFLLGVNISTGMWFSTYSGVVSGCHRWDIHNGLIACAHAVSVGCMVGSLYLGGGLITLSAITLACAVVNNLAHLIAAYRVYPGLQVRARLASWNQTMEMLIFGWKSLVPSVSELMLQQTVNILVLAYLGPSALALYARPKALVRVMQSLMAKFSYVLTATAGALDSEARIAELRDFLTKALRYAYYLILPPTIVLMVYGDTILGLWMGPAYRNWALPAVLAAGSLTTIAHMPVLSVLAGMDAHGRPGIANLTANCFAVATVVVSLWVTPTGLVGVASCAVIPVALVNGIYLPIYACRRLRMSMRECGAKVLRGPLLSSLPLIACLVGTRVSFHARPHVALACGMILGLVVVAVVYWQYALPPRVREVTRKLLRVVPVSR